MPHTIAFGKIYIFRNALIGLDYYFILNTKSVLKS